MAWSALPLFVRVAGRPVILLGEGEAADAKRRLLERAGAVVVRDHPDARLAIVAIEDEAAAIAAAEALRARGVLVNVVDRPAQCDFTVPAIVDRSPVLVAIGTGGVSAGLAAALRQRLEALLPARLGALADALHAARGRLRGLLPDGAERRRAIGAALGGELDPMRAGSDTRVAAWLETFHVEHSPTAHLVEIRLASPDPEDLTLRQVRALAQADTVLHSAAVPAAILDRARADAARIACEAPPDAPGPGLTVWLAMRG